MKTTIMRRAAPQAPLTARAGLRLIARTLRDAPGWGALVVFCAVGGGALALLAPAVLALAVDAAVRGRALGDELALLAAIVAAETAIDAVGPIARASYSATVTARLRQRYVDHVLELGCQGTRRFGTGGLVSRLTVDTPGAGELLPVLAGAMVTAATALVALVALASMDWRLLATVGLGLPAMAMLVRRFVVQTGGLLERYQALQSAIATRLLDAHAGARTIRASATSAQEVQRVLRPRPQLSRTGRELWSAQRALSAPAALLLPCLEVLVIGVAGISVVEHRISPGELLAAAIYLRLTLGALDGIDQLMNSVRARVGARRTAEVLETASSTPSAPGAPPLPAGPGALSLRGVTVGSGDGGLILDRLDLDVPAGASVAVVGCSGAGKSTLAALVGRLSDPDEGTVSLDGADLKTVDLGATRRAVAYAFERPALLGEDLHAMIAYGRPDATAADVQAAAQTAQADDFIRCLPAGYATVLADAPLSGGERQRLGLAQAVVQDARLVVLDDATSSLDTATELRVAQALERTLGGRTSLVVAHRAGTAARADLVAWLDRGRVRALAPHAALWQHAAYRAVFAAGDLRIPAEDLVA
ncbi:MAG: ATP-binding cassette, subfamily bacterial [Solirubrobacteraceae bacterium]|nr:ATP-binding cassette, subfamily bacterial [Solirubrobacteraceae bacterium]